MAGADITSPFAPWLDALPAIVAALQPAAAMSPKADADGNPDPLGVLRQAFEFANPAQPRPFEAWMPLLRQGGIAPLTETLRALAALGDENLRRVAEAWSGGGQTAWKTLLGTPASAGANPLAQGAERTFGAFADALGLRQKRELGDALQRLGSAENERRSALSAYLGLIAQALGQGSQQLLARLDEMAARGEQVTSVVAFLRLWAREADGALQQVLHTEAGLATTAHALRASLQRRAELQRLVALASNALNIPTRAEVDDAFREIQDLKRALRLLRKGAPPQTDDLAETPAASAAPRAARPAPRKAAAKPAASAPRGAAKPRATGARK